MPRAGETLVTVQVRCPEGCGQRWLQDALTSWLRKHGCSVERIAVTPAPPPDSDS